MKAASKTDILLALLVCGVWGTAARAQTLASFTAAYRGGSSTCGTAYNIQGREPATAGAYPVFIYLVGTTESYTQASAMAAVEEMAGRGYIAATVQYPNSTFGACSTLTGRSKCIFDGSSATSAVSTLCSRPNAACSKGVVVAGFNRLRVVNGEADGFMGGTESSVRSQLQQLTGLTCTATSTSCFRANSSGWYLVKHAEVSDGNADHCYMRGGGCTGGTLDQKWLNGTYGWSVDPNLQWLSQFTQR